MGHFSTISSKGQVANGLVWRLATAWNSWLRTSVLWSGTHGSKSLRKICRNIGHFSRRDEEINAWIDDIRSDKDYE
jgi:hypothetical protein